MEARAFIPPPISTCVNILEGEANRLILWRPDRRTVDERWFAAMQSDGQVGGILAPFCCLHNDLFSL